MIAALILLAQAHDPRVILGTDLAERGDLRAAEDVFREAYMDGVRRAALGLGLVLLEEGEPEEALLCLEEIGAPEFIARARYAAKLPCIPEMRAAVTSDPTSVYNLAAAVHAENGNARWFLCDALSNTCENRWFVPHALRILAEYEPPHMARRLFDQADYLEERTAWEPARR